jgi:membrane protease YdiL (CAAX protease family)
MQSTVATPVVGSGPNFFLDEIREASRACILFVCAADAIAAGLFLWKPGVLTLASTWVVCIGVGIFAWARLRPADLGLSLRGLILGFVYGYCLANVDRGRIACRCFPESLAGRASGIWGNMGLLADQFLFFATSEEIVFRGFLLGQLYRKLRDLLTA